MPSFSNLLSTSSQTTPLLPLKEAPTLTFFTRFLASLLLLAKTLTSSSDPNCSYTERCLFLLPLCLQLTQITYLFKGKSKTVLGILYLLSDLLTSTLVLKIHRNPLNFHTVTLSHIILCLLQDYPAFITYILGSVYFLLHIYSRAHLQLYFNESTNTYNLPASDISCSFEANITLLILLFLLFIAPRLQADQINNQLELKTQHKEQIRTLENKLRDTERDLHTAKNEMNHMGQSHELFVACVSHELRNPLNVILGNLDILYSLAKDNDEAQILKISKLCGETLLSQVNNLLDVAKIKAGKLEINELPTKMSNFLEEFWMMSKRVIEKKELTGRLLINKNLPACIKIDNHRLQQILHNLVSNAVKFTNKGSIQIIFSWAESVNEGQSIILKRESIELDNENSPILKPLHHIEPQIPSIGTLDKLLDEETINFSTKQSVEKKLNEVLGSPYELDCEGRIQIEIIDTGCGISEENQKRIFEPFEQGDKTITRNHGGFGLGLYIVRRVVKEMGGEIVLSSKVGTGSHFKLLLPATIFLQPRVASSMPQTIEEALRYRRNSKRQSSGASSVWRLPPSSPKKFLTQLNLTPEVRRVLIVEDIQFNRDVLKTYFETLHFETEFACNGLEGLQMYQDNPEKYTLITMDIQMPVMDGITAIKYIRGFENRMEKYRRIPIVVVSGNCADEEIKQCMEQADYFFRKPFGLNECRLCVQNILSTQMIIGSMKL